MKRFIKYAVIAIVILSIGFSTAWINKSFNVESIVVASLLVAYIIFFMRLLFRMFRK